MKNTFDFGLFLNIQYTRLCHVFRIAHSVQQFQRSTSPASRHHRTVSLRTPDSKFPISNCIYSMCRLFTIGWSVIVPMSVGLSVHVLCYFGFCAGCIVHLLLQTHPSVRRPGNIGSTALLRDRRTDYYLVSDKSNNSDKKKLNKFHRHVTKRN